MQAPPPPLHEDASTLDRHKFFQQLNFVFIIMLLSAIVAVSVVLSVVAVFSGVLVLKRVPLTVLQIYPLKPSQLKSQAKY